MRGAYTLRSLAWSCSSSRWFKNYHFCLSLRKLRFKHTSVLARVLYLTPWFTSLTNALRQIEGGKIITIIGIGQVITLLPLSNSSCHLVYVRGRLGAIGITAPGMPSRALPLLYRIKFRTLTFVSLARSHTLQQTCTRLARNVLAN
jgi:hypothetical protein